VQEIEVLGLRELLRLGDAFGEGIPGHDGLDGGERIAARLLGLDQRLADAPEQPHLGVDRLAGCLKLLLMFLAALNSLPRMRSCRSMISSVTVAMPSMASATRGGVPLRLELGQVGGRHLATSRAILSRRFWCTAARCRKAGRAPATP
jgi:hypothetical protein